MSVLQRFWEPQVPVPPLELLADDAAVVEPELLLDPLDELAVVIELELEPELEPELELEPLLELDELLDVEDEDEDEDEDEELPELELLLLEPASLLPDPEQAEVAAAVSRMAQRRELEVICVPRFPWLV